MGLADDLAAVKNPRYTSLVDRILAELKDSDDGKALLAALRDQDNWSSRAISDTLAKAGYDLQRSTVQLWRTKDKAAHPEFYDGQKTQGPTTNRPTTRRKTS